MDRFAIFVDAGYLFAEGGRALEGHVPKRSEIEITTNLAIETIRDKSAKLASGCSLLRIYWYDGASAQGPSAQQLSLAQSNDVKLRLGIVNNFGKQKGVDSLIVTDMVDLARNRAMSDAVVLSGDEDVRIGLQVAQNYGVRVHLLGIQSETNSQSQFLKQEADTTTELTRDEISRFITVKSSKQIKKPAPLLVLFDNKKSVILEIIQKTLSDLKNRPEEFSAVAEYVKSKQGLPKDVDGKLIATCRDSLNRNLDQNEKREVRQMLSAEIKAA